VLTSWARCLRQLSEEIEVKLLRRESQRLVVEEEAAVLYYAAGNPRTYDAKQPQSLEFPLDVRRPATSLSSSVTVTGASSTHDTRTHERLSPLLRQAAIGIEFILLNGGDWVKLGDVPLETWAEREVLARSLIANDILLVRQAQ
jgi:hypothetical protein